MKEQYLGEYDELEGMVTLAAKGHFSDIDNEEKFESYLNGVCYCSAVVTYSHYSRL